MSHVKPSEVLKQVADAVPEDCWENIVIIGSLAAAYAYFGDNDEMAVHTKDLGRVLAIGFLAEEKGQRDFRPWGSEWALTLNSCFKEEWKILAKNAGSGLRSLLDSDEDLEEAHHTCVYGLLASYGFSKET